MSLKIFVKWFMGSRLTYTANYVMTAATDAEPGSESSRKIYVKKLDLFFKIFNTAITSILQYGYWLAGG